MPPSVVALPPSPTSTRGAPDARAAASCRPSPADDARSGTDASTGPTRSQPDGPGGLDDGRPVGQHGEARPQRSAEGVDGVDHDLVARPPVEQRVDQPLAAVGDPDDDHLGARDRGADPGRRRLAGLRGCVSDPLNESNAATTFTAPACRSREAERGRSGTAAVPDRPRLVRRVAGQASVRTRSATRPARSVSTWRSVAMRSLQLGDLGLGVGEDALGLGPGDPGDLVGGLLAVEQQPVLVRAQAVAALPVEPQRRLRPPGR